LTIEELLSDNARKPTEKVSFGVDNDLRSKALVIRKANQIFQ
jgi:hypothetical protein